MLLPLEGIAHLPSLNEALPTHLILPDIAWALSIPSDIFLAQNDPKSSFLAQLQTPSLEVGGIFGSLLDGLDFSKHPMIAIFTSFCIVTVSDMVPFVPCQPIAIALGAKLGFLVAFPITLFGQTTAGVLAFSGARKAAASDIAQNVASSKLSEEAMETLEELRNMTDAAKQGDGKILLALIGLRLAPFFPFSAGNYLLGSTTSVPLRLFIVSTLLGCITSNLLSVGLGAGGAIMFTSENVNRLTLPWSL